MTTELKEMLAKATPGPWTLRDDGTISSEHGEIGVIDVPDGPLIVHLRNHAEDYLAAVEALERLYGNVNRLLDNAPHTGISRNFIARKHDVEYDLRDARAALARLREQGADR